MSFILKYKVRPNSGWIHSDPFESREDAVAAANKLITVNECCKVEIYEHIATGRPIAPAVQIDWTVREKNYENGEGIPSRT